MLDGMCNAVETPRGKMVCAVLTTVAGLHLMTTESQPVLGMIDAPSFGWFSVQHILGIGVTVCGACCLMNCMRK